MYFRYHTFGNTPWVCLFSILCYLRNVHGGCSKVLSPNSKHTFIEFQRIAKNPNVVQVMCHR